MADKLPAAQKAQRDAELCSDLALGMTQAKAAAKYDLDDRTVRRIWTQFGERAKSDLRGRDPIDIVWELVEGYKARHTALAEIAAMSDKPGLRISAMRAQNDVADRMTSLLQATGILPRNLGQLRIEMDVRYVAQTLLRIFQEERIPDNVQQRVVETLRGGRN